MTSTVMEGAGVYFDYSCALHLVKEIFFCFVFDMNYINYMLMNSLYFCAESTRSELHMDRRLGS